MAASGVTASAHQAAKKASRTTAIVILGIVGGLVVSYTTAVIGGAPIPGESTTSPAVLLLLAALVVISVAGGWRWPLVGVSAGMTMALIILFAVVQHVGWSSGSSWLNPFESVGYGAVSGYPAMIAAVILSVSILRRHANTARG